MRHDWNLKDAFCGFIYDFGVANYAKTDFSDSLFSSCEGEGEGGICLSDCAYNEKQIGAACVACSGHGD